MNKLNLILKQAEKERAALNHPYVGTEHLTLAILAKENELTNELKNYNLTYNKFKRKLISIVGKESTKNDYILYTPMLRNVLNTAEKRAMEESIEVNEKILFESVINEGEGIAIRVMEAMKIDITSINLDNASKEMKVSLTDSVTNREKELAMICQILMRKDKCNPLLIGDAGVGKTAIVEELVRRIRKNKVPTQLKNYKIIKLDLSELLSGTKYRGEFEEKINKILHQAENTKTILFIDEIHTLVTAGGADGAIAAGDILKPYLARGDIKCIGATTVNEYQEHFAVDQALNRRFQTIIINETSSNITINILNKIKPNYETFHKVKITSELINNIVEFGNRYITNRKNPDKSIELLDSCCTHALFNNKNEVSINDLYEIIKERYGLDLSNKNIIDIIKKEEPISIKVLTELNIQDNPNIININCNNYQTEYDLYDLLGNPNDLHKSQNYLLKSVREYPLGVITLTNRNSTKILKEFISKLVTKRIIMDNYGNKLNLKNYIIAIDSPSEIKTLGFTLDDKENCVKSPKYYQDETQLLKI